MKVDNNKYPHFSSIIKKLDNEAFKISNGGAEYIYSKDWLNIYWPVDEYLFIEHAKNNNFETLYKEILGILTDTIKTFNSEINDFYGEESIIEIIKEACLLNNWLLNVPEKYEDSKIQTFWNIGKPFISINGRFQSLERSKNKFNYSLKKKATLILLMNGYRMLFGTVIKGIM